MAHQKRKESTGIALCFSGGELMSTDMKKFVFSTGTSLQIIKSIVLIGRLFLTE